MATKKKADAKADETPKQDAAELFREYLAAVDGQPGRAKQLAEELQALLES